MALWLIFAVLLAKFFPTLFFCLIGVGVARMFYWGLSAILVGFFGWLLEPFFLSKKKGF